MAATPAPSIALTEQTIDGLRVIYLGPSALVASERTPGQWYHVDADGHCGCPDHVYREKVCKHMRVVRVAAELDRLNATPVESGDPDPTPAAPAACPCDRRALPPIYPRNGRPAAALITLRDDLERAPMPLGGM